MAEAKATTKSRKLNAVEVFYAKIMCNMSNESRLKIFRKIASLMKNRFSLMNAIDLLYDSITDGGKNTSDPMAVALASWGKSLQNGLSFADALKGWAPDRERLMLSAGDVSDLETALFNLIRVTEGTNKMIQPIIGAISYPSFLFLAAIFVVYAIGVYMVPPMLEAAPGVYWKGSAKDLVNVSEWIKENWLAAFLFLPVTMIIIYATIGVWTGKVRAYFDRIPPWSLYKVFSGITWLLSLSALVKGGVPVSAALTTLLKESNRYMKERIEKTLVFINNGENLGVALAKTGLEFPDREIIADLRVYSELDNFEEALENLANDWLEQSVYMIAQKAEMLNTVAMLAVSGVIAWSVFAVFEMQDQITNAMGM